MAADYAALETRVAELEQQMRHVLPAKVDALAYGLSLVHADIQAMRGDIQAIRSTQGRQETALQEILRRLPE